VGTDKDRAEILGDDTGVEAGRLEVLVSEDRPDVADLGRPG